MAHVEAVAGARVVHVVALVVLDQAVVGLVVDALERQRRAEVVALGGVVVDHVEDDLDARVMEPRDHGLELVDHAGREVARMGGKEPDRIIAPVVG